MMSHQYDNHDLYVECQKVFIKIECLIQPHAYTTYAPEWT